MSHSRIPDAQPTALDRDLPPPPYDRDALVNVLIYHYRNGIEGCGCGWAKPGRSWPEHVATVYEKSVAARAATASASIDPACWCADCDDARRKVMTEANPNEPWRVPNRFMILCPICGNKRCPHATNHANPCTASNEPGQPGSNYGGRTA